MRVSKRVFWLREQFWHHLPEIIIELKIRPAFVQNKVKNNKFVKIPLF